MAFSTIEFLFQFLPIFLLAYYITPAKYRNIILILGSFIFYAIGSGWYLILLIFSVFVNYILSRLLRTEEYFAQRRNQAILVIGLIFDFGLLVIFKYTNFILENLNALLSHISIAIPEPSLTMPLGISFFTFQITSYLIDVYTKKTRPANSILELGIYICMFPNLISGPIATFGEMRPQFLYRTVNVQVLEEGIRLFVIGLSAKTLLADPMSGLWNNLSVIGYDYVSTPYAWLGAVAYSFEIYFDFSSYSMMAIGIGMMLGFELPQNFNLPYCSDSVGEFWRRWHMTLGRWFRNYIYIPLGGNRHGTLKTIRNLLAVWVFTGLWHGASWNYILWGMIFFVLQLGERFIYGKKLEKTHVLKHIYMILIIPLTWIVFAITDLSQLGQYFLRLFPFLTDSSVRQNYSDFTLALNNYWKILIPCFLFSTPLPLHFYKKYRKSVICLIILVVLFIYSIKVMMESTNNPFLYFQF